MKNSATGVTRLMAKFKVGQRVFIQYHSPFNYKGFGIVRDATHVTFNDFDGNYRTEYRYICLRDDGCTLYGLRDKELSLLLCPVCEQEIEIENDKIIKEHKHNDELCYGSYIPFQGTS